VDWVGVHFKAAFGNVLDLTQDLIRERDHASKASVELDRDASIHWQADIIPHLADVHFDHQERFSPRGKFGHTRVWVRADRYRAEQADLDALFAVSAHGGKRYASNRAEADHDDFRVTEEVFFVSQFLICILGPSSFNYMLL
jgi:hypothetical protein